MEKQDINLSLIITLLILYFGTCGGLWYLGFWSKFDINYLQYITLSDIIKNFAYPFLASCTIFTITFVLMILIHTIENLNYKNENLNIFKNESFIFGKGRNTIIGKFLNKYLKIFILIYIFLILIIIQFGNDEKWNILPMIISYPFSIFLTNKSVLFNKINNLDIRFSIITFIVILPLISFCFSKKESLDVYKNVKYNIVSKIEFKSDDNKLKNNIIGLKFLGSTSEKIFLSTLNNRELTILSTESINYISYKKNKQNLH